MLDQVPNAVGFVLGTAQLILYTVYKKKSMSSTDKMEEEGSAHLVKGMIQMRALDKDDEKAAALKNRSLNKGRSLPKPSAIRQYSFQRILKTFSLNPHEIHSNWALEVDVENGEKINHS
jgi:solute carrier family 50 protein (sugar transporter)